MLLIVAASVAAASVKPGLLDEGSHCVAYKVEKVMFLVSSSAVIGKNCDISAQVLPEVGGLYHIEVNIPIRSFSSGDEGLDQDVQEILRGKERAELTFRSGAKFAEQWRELFKSGEFDMEGELMIGAKAYPLKIKTHYIEKDDGAAVEGVAKVLFKDFGIKPPKVVGGLVTKTKPDLELHFHLLTQRILGADTIRPGRTKE